MRYLLAGIGVVVLVVAGLLAWALRHPEIAPVSPPAADAFPAEQVQRGALLAAIGNCVVCHTAPGGAPNAGGGAMDTPFGVIYATNITPDPQTGIGAWSPEAFRRAMHEGVARDGSYLYPAFPYDHFTRVSDEDVEAIYAYLMTRPAVSNVAPANEMGFPFNQRILMAGWNLLFHDDGRFEPDPARTESWNRGAYLVEGLGHCGACHTPRNAFGALREGEHLGGAEIYGWHAPALNANSPAPVPWTADAMVNYLLDGWDRDHGVAAGPMTPVVDQLGAALSEDDAYAIAEYLLSFQDASGAAERTAAARAFSETREFGGGVTPPTGPVDIGGPELVAGQQTFARLCASCHRAGTGSVPLALSTSVAGPDPSNLIHVIQFGIVPPDMAFDRSMPAFGGGLTDAQMLELVEFIRAHFTDQPAWPDAAERVRAIRGG